MKQLIHFCTTLILICSLNASGQGNVRYLTLKESIEIAKANSPDALNAKQVFRTSFWEFRSYRASNLPALELSSTLPYLNQGFSTYQDSSGNRSYVRSQYLSTKMSLGFPNKLVSPEEQYRSILRWREPGTRQGAIPIRSSVFR